MAQVARYAGRCHCGNLKLTFESPSAPEDLMVRSCSCSFCRRHGARCVSDPAGAVRIAVDDPALLLRYRFGLGTADFLVCRQCGVYVGAVMPVGDSAVATINVNTFDPPHPFERAGLAVDYGGESEPERRARRSAGWTPTVFEDARAGGARSGSILIAGSEVPRQVNR